MNEASGPCLSGFFDEKILALPDVHHSSSSLWTAYFLGLLCTHFFIFSSALILFAHHCAAF